MDAAGGGGGAHLYAKLAVEVDGSSTAPPSHLALKMYRLRIREKWFSVMKQTAWTIFFSLLLLETKQAVTLSLVADSLYKHRRWGLSFPITPSHPLIISSPDPTHWDGQPDLMKASRFTAPPKEPRRGLFCHPPLFNQFTGRDPQKRWDDYCCGVASVLAERLSNLANTSSAVCQIEQ